MYNIKCCCDMVMKALQKEGYRAEFCGEYPWEKCYNANHQPTRINAEEVEVVTDATIDVLQRLFKIIEIKNSFVKACVAECVIKQNIVHVNIYYRGTSVSKVDGTVLEAKNFEDVLRTRTFLHETITIDSKGAMHNFPGKKDAYRDVDTETFGTVKEVNTTFQLDPLSMLNLIVKIGKYKRFRLLRKQKQALADHYQLLAYEDFKDITICVNQFMGTRFPKKCIKAIKENMIDFQYKARKPFEFLSYLKDETIENLGELDKEDLIARWAYVLKDVPEDVRGKTIRMFKLDAIRINWLIKYYDMPLLDVSQYKQTIYDAKEDLNPLRDRRCNIFILYPMLCKLKMIYSAIDPDNERKYQKLLDVVCGRPMYLEQIYYEDEDICKLLNVSFQNIELEWFTKYKTDVIYNVLMTDVHPSDAEYLQIMHDLFDTKYANLEEVIPTFEGEYEAQYEEEYEDEEEEEGTTEEAEAMEHSEE